MSNKQRYWQYMVFSADILDRYREGTDSISTFISHLWPTFAAADASVRRLPSLAWGYYPRDEELVARPPHALVVPLSFADRDSLQLFLDEVAANPVASLLGVGADIAATAVEYQTHWCPNNAADPIFGRRSAAHALVNADYLKQRQLTGRNVNIVVVDQGIDKSQIPSANFGNGWTMGNQSPGAAGDEHGAMLVRNIRAIAPDALLFDCPVVPARIGDLSGFLSDIEAAYHRMLTDIAIWQSQSRYPGPWIFVNAWAVMDRRQDIPAGSYTNNPQHPFNQIIDTAADSFDFVFGAGNGGQFCPDVRCGPNDRGPGNSIFGANCLGSVLTLGAVRTDAMWLGFSSQGPGQPNLEHKKPDLCAPSQFADDHNAAHNNTGTSASAAIAVGVVSALRQRWSTDVISPDDLKRVLNLSARRPPGAPWDKRFGHGILDARRAYALAHFLYGDGNADD
jgi:hypothetical protein